MTHPLHDHIARRLAERLKSKKVVVWYDPRAEFSTFVDELDAAPSDASASTDNPFVAEVTKVQIGPTDAWIARYDGSFFKLRACVESLTDRDEPERVVIYIAGRTRDAKGSVLMEFEKAGETYEPGLKRLARDVLRERYTDGVIDDLLNRDGVTYDDLARAAEGASSSEAPSILKSIYHDVPGNDALLANWIALPARDAEIDAKQATPELIRLVLSRLNLEFPSPAALGKLRAITLRYLLVAEFRSDLKCEAPSSLASVPEPKTKDDITSARDMARRLRTSFASEYQVLANQVEKELGLATATLPAEALGSIDTFSFEERALLVHCGDLIAAEKFDAALKIVAEREQSFWLDHNLPRKFQWEACRRMAELGGIAVSVRSDVLKASGDASAWIDAYTTANTGWYRLDQAQRRLETWLPNLDDEAQERPLGIARRTYEDACRAMADGFTKALAKASWSAPGSMSQTHVYSDVVAGRPKPVAYFLVDAMRYEMGVELAERLPKAAEISVRHAVAALPSITPIGMAALQPGAAASFSVIEQKGKLGSSIEGAFLPDVGARIKFAAARVPKLVDVTLDDVLGGMQRSKLQKKLEGAQVVIVRSQEIDHAGENTPTRQARRIMDDVLGDLARAIGQLAKLGVEHSVVSADHGHLFFATDRDDSMKIDAPGGDQVDLHRRCWIGRGGSTPSGCIRVAASALGYDSDLDFVFPSGCAVFKSGGDLAFHHGGPTLQELIVPVLTVRLKVRESGRPTAGPVSAAGLPDAVTNRIFSVTLTLGGANLQMFSSEMVVRPVLVSAGKHVGAVGMVVDGELDRSTGCVKLKPNKPLTIAFLLSDDTASSLRVVVQDPATDAELYRSPTEIPVRLGV
jgi:hypothetical protein